MLCHLGDETLTIHAPAKLNLFLEVLGRRADGFHELETLMVSVGLYDTLRLRHTTSEHIELTNSGIGTSGAGQMSEIPEGRTNLVVRAAELLREATGTSAGARVSLHKRIPAAAGMAGGSSDAAAALLGFNQLWRLGLAHAELHELAARLGSDVPFFLSSSSAAICRGRGERIEPVHWPTRLYFVVVRPATGLSTAEVFQNCRPQEERRSVEALATMLAKGDLGQAGQQLHNRLLEPALRLNEDVNRLRRTFAKLPVLGHMMSGSGTSYFGICAHRKHARTVAARLHATRIGSVFTVESRP